MQGIINEKGEVIAIANSCLNMVDGYEVFEVEDVEIKIGYVRNKDGTFEKGENLVKQEEVEEFKRLKKQYIDVENDEKIKLILGIEEKPTKSSESPLDTLKTQITDLYNELIKTYGNEIKEQLF